MTISLTLRHQLRVTIHLYSTFSGDLRSATVPGPTGRLRTMDAGTVINSIPKGEIGSVESLFLWSPLLLPIRLDRIIDLADWGQINGYPFFGSSSPIAPNDKSYRILR